MKMTATAMVKMKKKTVLTEMCMITTAGTLTATTTRMATTATMTTVIILHENKINNSQFFI